MPVDVTVALENLTMGDLYRFVDFARAARLPATARVKQVTDDEGERIVALTATVSGGETAPRPAPAAARPAAPRRAPTNVAGAVGEAVGYIDDLRRKFNTPPSG
jgi:hypothetical protein